MSCSAAAVAMALICAPLGAQYGLPPSPDALLVGRYRSPLTYEAALDRLDHYYQEQIGRKLSVALPRIGPRAHFDAWHDIWIFFEPDAAGTTVTMKHAGDALTTRLGKGWMLEIAGRIQGALPLDFQELPPLRSLEADIFASRHDLMRALRDEPSLASIPTWEHAGLIVSPAPLTSVTLAFAGSRGLHRVKVTAESAPAAKQLLARLLAEAARPCICGVYSETVELDGELERLSREKAAEVGALTVTPFSLGQVDPKAIENRLRGEPEMQKRIAAASGYYNIRFRIDKPYARVSIRWSELVGYNREDGRFHEELPRGQSSVTAPRSAPGAPPLTGRTRLEALASGAYRIRLEGELAGQKVKIDERDFWFDGKTFEEL